VSFPSPNINIFNFYGQVFPDENLEQLTNLAGSTNNGKSADNASFQHTITKDNTSTPQDAGTSCDDDSTLESMTYVLKNMRLDRLDSDRYSFFGKSSQFMLAMAALDLKNEYLGQKPSNDHIPMQAK
jgi:hypothetical protein